MQLCVAVGILATMRALLTRQSVISNPGSYHFLIDFASREALECGHRLDLLGGKGESVEKQKGTHSQQGYALVAIDEGMIASQTKGVLGRQIEEVRIVSIGKELSRPSKSALKQTGISQSRASSEEPE